MSASLILLTSIIISSCYAQSDSLNRGHDPQFIQIFLHFGARDELDTFNGTYQKDLIPGIARTTIWLTTREQEIIVTKLERLHFFSLRDTIIHLPPNITISPNLGLQELRIKYKNIERTFKWDDGVEKMGWIMYFITEVQSLLYDIIVSKPEYKALPPTTGGYQ